MKYAFVMTAYRQEQDGRAESHTFLGFVDAQSVDEAIGKATRIAVKAFPVKDGYHGHHANARSVEDPITDPDLPIELTVKSSHRS